MRVCFLNYLKLKCFRLTRFPGDSKAVAEDEEESESVSVAMVAANSERTICQSGKLFSFVLIFL